MGDCSKHKKEIAGISDMKVLAEMIGDLHYETLVKLLGNLAVKIGLDGKNDFKKGRKKLGEKLVDAAFHIKTAQIEINEAWQICKPFMNNLNTKL